MVITPAPRSFIIGAAYFAARNAPSRFTDTQTRQSSSVMSSTKAVGPATPALAHKTSNPPHFTLISLNKSDTAASSAASTRRPTQPLGRSASVSRSTSVTQTRAPALANASPMARPMPDAPAVIRTRAWSSPLTASPKWRARRHRGAADPRAPWQSRPAWPRHVARVARGGGFPG